MGTECPSCHGKRLQRDALSVTFAGIDIAEIFAVIAQKSLAEAIGDPYADSKGAALKKLTAAASRESDCPRSGSRKDIASAAGSCAGKLGLGYLTLERSTPTALPWVSCSDFFDWRRRFGRIYLVSSMCSTSLRRDCNPADTEGAVGGPLID